jgi:C4-dicarboxylate-specific signal transduction histidine kinase
MVQVLTNLIQNAIDAIRGTPDGRVSVEVRTVGERAKLTVRDNGPGFAPDARGRLFEPYFTTKAEGTGLGLAIVERIVVEHGGDISVDPNAQQGATLLVDLPVAGPALLPEPGLPPSSAAPGRPAN